MQSFDVIIEGATALLQHRFAEAAEAGTGSATRRVNVDRGTPREQAEQVSYRENGDGSPLYLPGAAIARLLREAGGGHKQKGSRKSCKYIVPAAVRMAQDTVPLYKKNRKTRIKDFEVDSRPVVIPSTKGRIMRHRPRLDQWVAKFTLVINEDVLPPEFVLQLLTEGGQQIGVGDYRPEKGGPFGVFNVVEWEERGAREALDKLADEL